MALEQSVDPHISTPVTVTRLAGTVTVIDQQGAARELHIGDQVQPGEHISVSPNSGVLLLLPDGNMLPVGNMPAVQDFTDPDEISLEDLPVQAPLTAGEGEALIAAAESRNIADSSNDEKGTPGLYSADYL